MKRKAKWPKLERGRLSAARRAPERRDSARRAAEPVAVLGGVPDGYKPLFYQGTTAVASSTGRVAWRSVCRPKA